jgi:peptidoglycan/LPS O-acetylase OafA/YrhL
MNQRSLGYVSALDGVRGVAILLVVACHYFLFPLDGGPVGVGLFFVLSGFLITTLLLEEHANTGRVNFAAFYRRRARRLLPALAVLLALFVVVEAADGRGTKAAEIAVVGGAYAGNVVQAFSFHDILSGTCLAHLWSLAQEEQFYLVWPLLLVGLLRTRRRFLFTGLLLAAATSYRIILVVHGSPLTRIYYGPDTRADWLLAGAFLATWRHRGLRVPEWVPLVGFAALFLGLFLNPWSHAWLTWQSSVIIAASAALVAAAAADTQMAHLLSARWLVWVGRLSYSLYLWHVPVFAALGYHDPEVALPLAITMAWLSYRFVEKPFRRRRMRQVEPVVATGLSPAAPEVS